MTQDITIQVHVYKAFFNVEQHFLSFIADLGHILFKNAYSGRWGFYSIL